MSDGYPLMNEDLLQFGAANGMKAVCHLLIYYAETVVCVVGNFDELLGSSTTQAIEEVATRVSERVGRDEFRLIQWYPRDLDRPFSEVTLSRTAPRRIEHGSIVVAGEDQSQTVRRDTRVVRYADPQFVARSEDDVAALLGQEAVRELRSYAGMPGEYTPERLFGTTGAELAAMIRAHNRAVGDAIVAQSQEWTGP